MSANSSGAGNVIISSDPDSRLTSGRGERALMRMSAAEGDLEERQEGTGDGNRKIF